MRVKRSLYLGLGFIGLGLGALEAVLPMIPAFPFLLLAAFGFGRGSEKLHRRFVRSKLYKENLESYVAGKGMTMRAKVRMMTTVTLLMSVGFLMMGKVPAGRVVLGVIWFFHIVYFLLGIKTVAADGAAEKTGVVKTYGAPGARRREKGHPLKEMGRDA